MGTSLGKGDGNHGGGFAFRMRGSMQKKGVFPFCRIFGTAKKRKRNNGRTMTRINLFCRMRLGNY